MYRTYYVGGNVKRSPDCKVLRIAEPVNSFTRDGAKCKFIKRNGFLAFDRILALKGGAVCFI